MVGAGAGTAVAGYRTVPGTGSAIRLAVLDADTGAIRTTVQLPDDVVDVIGCAVATGHASCAVDAADGARIVFVDTASGALMATVPVGERRRVAAVDGGFLVWSESSAPALYLPDGSRKWAADGDRFTVVPDAGLILAIQQSREPAQTGEARVLRTRDGRTVYSEPVRFGAVDPEFQALSDGFALRMPGGPLGLYGKDGVYNADGTARRTGDDTRSWSLAPVRIRDRSGPHLATPALPVAMLIRGDAEKTEVAAADPVTGTVAWRVSVNARVPDVSVTAVGRSVVIAYSSGSVRVVNAATGEVGGLVTTGAVIGTDGEFVAQRDLTGDGFDVYRVEPLRPPWEGPDTRKQSWSAPYPGQAFVAGGALYKGGTRLL